MKKLIISAVFLMALQISAYAQSGNIIITQQWARPILVEGRPGGAYLHIQNIADIDDKLISASSSISAKVEIHEHTMNDGVMKMGKVDFIKIPAHSEVQLKPGGYHIMLFNTKKKYAPGETIDLTLNFENAGTIEKTFEILAKQP
jgi:periplasmic copper chaperone A